MKDLLKISAILSLIEILVSITIPYIAEQGFMMPSLMVEVAALVFIASPLIYFSVFKTRARRIVS
jgi:hypothetical protein